MNKQQITQEDFDKKVFNDVRALSMRQKKVGITKITRMVELYLKERYEIK